MFITREYVNVVDVSLLFIGNSLKDCEIKVKSNEVMIKSKKELITEASNIDYKQKGNEYLQELLSRVKLL